MDSVPLGPRDRNRSSCEDICCDIMSSRVLLSAKWFALLGACLVGPTLGEFVLSRSGLGDFWWDSVSVPIGTWQTTHRWGRFLSYWIYPILDSPFLLWTLAFSLVIALCSQRYLLLLGAVYLSGRLGPFILEYLSGQHPSMESPFFFTNLLWRSLAFPAFVAGACIPRTVTLRRWPTIRNSIWHLLVFSLICAVGFISLLAIGQLRPGNVTIGWRAAIGPPLTCLSLLTFLACVQYSRVRGCDQSNPNDEP